MPPLLLDNLDGDGGWATLRGTLVKAANVRHTVPFCQHLVGKYLTAICDIGRTRINTLNLFMNIADDILKIEVHRTEGKQQLPYLILGVYTYIV